jgi:ATP-dependent RNA helicase RhlE
MLPAFPHRNLPHKRQVLSHPLNTNEIYCFSNASFIEDSVVSKTEDKTSSSKRTFGRKRDEEKSFSSEKPRGNSNRFGSKRGETSSITSRSKRVSSSLKNK